MVEGVPICWVPIDRDSDCVAFRCDILAFRTKTDTNTASVRMTIKERTLVELFGVTQHCDVLVWAWVCGVCYLIGFREVSKSWDLFEKCFDDKLIWGELRALTIQEMRGIWNICEELEGDKS